MKQDSVKKGSKVQIEFNTGISIGSKQRVDCYVTKVDYDRLTISFPEDLEEFYPYLTEGVEIRAFVYTFTGIVILDSVIFDSPYDGEMVIEYNEEHQIIQRRKYLRVPYKTDFYIHFDDRNIKVETIDVSGGGVRFLTSAVFNLSMKFVAYLRLGAFEPLINVEGIILKKNFYKKDEYVFEFLKIEETKRDKIIQKCIEIERELNKKY